MKVSNKRQNIFSGIALMGATGLLIGLTVDSVVLMVVACSLGCVVGGFVGWLGGTRFMLIICVGGLLGTAVGYSTGDRDILIVSAGSGAAIFGFIGAQLELFLGKP
ncbi:MAG: hypothetical protein G3M78_07455 [Candidatus Nitrohelix vancouverensis]|uniref:Uncharacterized protein n=1 Tax=Candidatus Nitrohelix vancouverensis TaxID=2705534 RepID=A0A7T0G4X6_9BACT|nr:MAG: hypothetical protein G3M78_07455 [Candidatus Nitrohelix vancouverensis]